MAKSEKNKEWIISLPISTGDGSTAYQLDEEDKQILQKLSEDSGHSLRKYITKHLKDTLIKPEKIKKFKNQE